VKKIFLDARELEHPKPLEEAIVALRGLDESDYFYMLHRKNPIPLLSLAQGQGLKLISHEEREGRWHILITKNINLDLQTLIEKL